MIKAIIFDCFGVLVGEGWKAFRDEHFGEAGERHEWAEEQMRQVSRGYRSHEDLADLMHEKTGVPQEEFLNILHNNPINTELFEYIEVLSERYKIGFLSNVGKNRLSELFTDQQLALFDAMTLSYEIGHAKPDPEAYRHTVKNLNVRAEECIFVDDTPVFCDGAEAVGMSAIVYTDFISFKHKLEAML